MKDRRAILENIKNKRKGVAKKVLDKIPQKATPPEEIKPYKKDVYDTYVMWYSIPLAIKNLSENEKIKMGLTELSITLSALRTKEQFAKAHGIDRSTLCDWDKKTSWAEVNAGMKRWQQAMTSNLRLALYKKAVRTGNAAEVMTWEKIVNDFSEKTTLEHSGEIYTLDPRRQAEIKAKFKKNAHRRGQR